MDHEQIMVEDRGPVRLVTLSRPDKLNAWTRRMSAELSDTIVDGNADPAIGAFVFTGAGRAFCAGADISGEFAAGLDADRGSNGDSSEGSASGDGEGGSDRPASGEGGGGDDPSDWVALVRRSKPMVAAVNGPSVGVGLTLILPMDRLVAGRSARLSARFVRMGLVPELASSNFLVQRCGWGAASDLALSGRMVGAEQAAAVGLVDEVVDDEVLVERALAVAAEYAASPPWAVLRIKELLTANACADDLGVVQRRELSALQEAYRTADHAEAVAAFLEKREPNFRP